MRRLVAMAALAGLACPAPAEKPAPRPAVPAPAGNGTSVLLITIDTLRADHLGAYGYKRPTSPHIDALAARGALFEQAYTYWPKTRGSFVAMMTGRRPSMSGYSKTHPIVLDFNPTLAATLKTAGYVTTALVDNSNVAAQHGFSRGFDRYRETWEETSLPTEMDRTRAITEEAVRFLAATRDRPFFLWLHYVNPHTPYQPPPPYDTAFLDVAAGAGPSLKVVRGFRGGVHENVAVAGKDRLGYYVSQYDGEIAAADAEVGKVLAALDAGPAAGKTLVLLSSDHGESLGEHDYYFDHGQDLFDPCLRVPLILMGPGIPAGRVSELASTLDFFPTVLDAVKVSYPPDLAGRSVLPWATGGPAEPRDRLFAGNDHHLAATFDARYKLVGTPEGDSRTLALYDRQSDRGELTDVRTRAADPFRVHRRELELYLERMERERAATERLVAGKPGEQPPSSQACEQLKALNYVATCP